MAGSGQNASIYSQAAVSLRWFPLLTAAIGLALNSAACVVVARWLPSHQHSRKLCYFLLNRCVGDLTSCAVVVLMAVGVRLDHSSRLPPSQQLLHYAVFTSVASLPSVATQATLSVTKLVCVVRPFYYKVRMSCFAPIGVGWSLVGAHTLLVAAALGAAATGAAAAGGGAGTAGGGGGRYLAAVVYTETAVGTLAYVLMLSIYLATVAALENKRRVRLPHTQAHLSETAKLHLTLLLFGVCNLPSTAAQVAVACTLPHLLACESPTSIDLMVLFCAVDRLFLTLRAVIAPLVNCWSHFHNTDLRVMRRRRHSIFDVAN